MHFHEAAPALELKARVNRVGAHARLAAQIPQAEMWFIDLIMMLAGNIMEKWCGKGCNMDLSPTTRSLGLRDDFYV